MRRDAEPSPKCLVKFTCRGNEKRLFGKALRCPTQEMKENEQGELCHHLIPRRCSCHGQVYSTATRLGSLYRSLQRPCNVLCNATPHVVVG